MTEYQYQWRPDAEIIDNDPPPPAADPDGTTASVIAAALKEDIIFGRLPPGNEAAREKLLERFGSSRYAIRDALSRLENRDIVVRERNRGAAVRTMPAEEVRGLHEVREILQRHAALRIRLPVSDADLAMLISIEEQ